jgi:predicted phage-related endonuclease
MLRSQRWPWMTANPDGLILADQHGYEGKTCNQWLAHEWGSPDDPLIPDHAELQAQWCMAVTGWSGWWVACLIGGQSNMYRFVHRDDVLIDSLVQVSYQFWTHNVLGNVAPDIDGSSALVDELKSRYPLADPNTEVQLSVDDFDLLAMLREKAKQAVKDAKEDDEAVKNRVRNFLGSKERLMCGELQIASWKHTKRFAEKKFRDAHPDIAAQYATTVPAVDVERLAKEKPDLYREFCSRELRFND